MGPVLTARPAPTADVEATAGSTVLDQDAEDTDHQVVEADTAPRPAAVAATATVDQAPGEATAAGQCEAGEGHHLLDTVAADRVHMVGEEDRRATAAMACTDRRTAPAAMAVAAAR